MSIQTKYRPAYFDNVIGHEHIVQSLSEAIAEDTSRAFLFTGPAGTGKTTLARVTAREAGVADDWVVEVDGATYNGVEAIREIVDQSRSYSLAIDGLRAFIIDECHQLSKPAWQVLLKSLEDVPDHVYWMLCTTEAHKVPKTVRTRCLDYELRPLSRSHLEDVLQLAITGEDWEIPVDIMSTIMDEANGSARQALSYLGKVHKAKDAHEARALLSRDTPAVEAIDLARCIFSQDFSLPRVQKLLRELNEQNPESIRIVVFAYAQSVFLGAKTERQAKFAARVMGALEEPIIETNRIGGLALRIARLLFLKG